MEEKIRVLVVDDEADFTQLMRSWLESKGYSVITVRDGKSAIRAVKEDTPDILFLDLRMPEMDGIEALKRIRAFNEEIPVILISAYITDPRMEKAMSYAVSGVFYKGKNFESVLPQLESALRSHKQLKKNKKESKDEK